MTIDKAQLKVLAEAVNESYAALCEHGGDELAEAWHSAELAYDDAANPVVVLALLAEIERLSPPAGQVSYQQQMEAWKSASSQDLRARGELMIQVDELKAESEALRKALLEASEEVAAWGAYASEYFQEKHDLAGCVAKLHAAAMAKEVSHG